MPAPTVVAVERDRRCIPALAGAPSSHSATGFRSSRATRWRSTKQRSLGEGAHVVANLPYNVGTALLLSGFAAIGRRGGAR